MPRTIDEGFRDFLVRLTPTATASSAAKNHRASIEACLKANFAMSRFFRTGSFGNGTSISGYSDVDYFAEIPPEKLREKSNNMLAAVRDVLDARFPNSGVRVSCPTVTIPFGSNIEERTEVAPASLVGSVRGKAVYNIADCDGGWMRSSPETHNAYVSYVDEKLGGKVKKLIRFIKAWKYFQNVPISSFYLELRVARYAEGRSSIIYSADVKRLYSLLDSNNLAAIRDPEGIGGLIAACSTEAKLQDARSKLSTALSRATKAVEAEEKSKIDDAFYWWNLLYNHQFPGYYR